MCILQLVIKRPKTSISQSSQQLNPNSQIIHNPNPPYAASNTITYIHSIVMQIMAYTNPLQLVNQP